MSYLKIWDAPEGAIGRDDFEVSVRIPGQNWEPLFVYEAKVDMHHVRQASMAYFDMEGTVEVRVESLKGPIQQAVIRPLSKRIPFEVEDAVVTFRLEEPCKLSIEVNGDRFSNLHLFANAPEENPPQPDAPNVMFLKPAIHRMADIDRLANRPLQPGGAAPEVIYFGPGMHYLEETIFRIPSGKTVYIAGGAIVVGSLVCDHVQDVAIRGRGVLYLSDFHRFSAFRGVRITFSHHISVEGIVLLDPPHYSIYIGKSEHIRIRNFKSFSTRGWSDGIDMMSSSHVEIDDVFLRTSDDCIAIYGSRWDYKGDSRCIHVKNSVLWADVAHAMNIGGHGDYRRGGDLIEDIKFSNIDILEHHEPQPGYWGAMNINVGDNNTVRNVCYEDIHVEDFELGQLVDLRVVFNEKYNPAAGKRIENVEFRNVTYNGRNENRNRIHGFNPERTVGGVTFTNLRINGELILSAEQGNFDINEHTHDIQFRIEYPFSKKGAWGDQGDGTYVNPVLPGDFSDPDVIRVGDDYYGISSTLHCSPGMAVLHSKDLVNWRMIGHVVKDLTSIGPEYNYDRMNRYGRGVWAGAIRFHKNKYWVYFFTPDEGLFMSTASDPAGPWAPLHQVWAVSGWDDCCPFWDDDGQGYFVATHFADNYNIHLFKLSEDGKELLFDSDTIIHQYKGSEANKLYKINGTYYFFHSEVRLEEGVEVRVVMMLRSEHIYGPYEEKEIIHTHGKEIDREPNQGGLVQTGSGDWYFISHQGSGDFEGRPLHLLPVTWVDGWPIIGNDIDGDGIGEMVWGGRKPLNGHPATDLSTNDDFDRAALEPYWEWNHQPRADKWSLTERPGYLRLHACQPIDKDNFFTVCNILSQRAYRTAHNEATVRLEIGGMADGQEAGLCHFAKTHCTIGVHQRNGTRVLKFNHSGTMEWGPELSGSTLWLRSVWNLDGISRFEYSVDGDHFTSFGDAYQLGWGNYRGDRIGLYSYNGEREQGYIDVDRFCYEVENI